MPGTFVLLDGSRDTVLFSNKARAEQRFIPASTFKIANSLIGLDAGVKKLDYGNMEIGNVVDRFWLDGPLAISAVEQTEFLHRLVEGKLPVSAEAIRAVRNITLLEKTETYELHGKTGWVFDVRQQIGWWVGWVEREAKIYPFALNIDMAREEDAAKRIPIGRECLQVLGKLR